MHIKTITISQNSFAASIQPSVANTFKIIVMPSFCPDEISVSAQYISSEKESCHDVKLALIYLRDYSLQFKM